ncbi:MAG: hypothetical protein WAS25_06340 [Geothrix sp.]|uniref:hypothetical protein n=1 Tax=Geothrix sp. TaxID=1962974 RepID=UPI003BAE4A19
MTPDEFTTRQLKVWKVPKTLQGLNLADLDDAAALPDHAIEAALVGKLPASFGLLAVGGDRVIAALLRQTLLAMVATHPRFLDDDRQNHQLLWVSWPVLFGELAMADLASDAYKATLTTLDRMQTVKVLVLTGLGDTPERPDRLEAALRGILTRRESEGLRTYWSSPLGLLQLRARYGRTGLLPEAAHV